MITQYSHVWFGWFWDKSPSWFLKILKLPSFYSGNFQIFKNALGEFIPNRPLKYVITSTNQTTYFYAKLNLGWTGLNFLTRKTNLHRFKQFIISIVEQRDSTIYRVLLSTNTPHGAERWDKYSHIKLNSIDYLMSTKKLPKSSFKCNKNISILASKAK